MSLAPIYELKEGHIYYSPSKKPFRYLGTIRHGQDCSLPMVVYMSMVETDRPAGTIFVIEESLFLKQFKEPMVDEHF